VAGYLEAVERVRESLPAATFGTDLIVGFPGEDEAAFDNTCRVVEEVGFSNLHVFRFSPRPGTLAAEFEDAVPEDAKRERVEGLIDRWHRGLRAILDKRIGSTQHVLVEERREGVWRGYTRDYIHVRFTSNEEIPIGSARFVRFTGAASEHLEGVDEQRTDAR
jgi:tRNA A37 methylthiotransferase MiaB